MWNRGRLTVEEDLQGHGVGGRAGDQSWRGGERQVAVRYVLPDEILDDGGGPVLAAVARLTRSERLPR